MNIERKVLRNKLKRRQGNNKIKGAFKYVKKAIKCGDYKTVNKILGE